MSSSASGLHPITAVNISGVIREPAVVAFSAEALEEVVEVKIGLCVWSSIYFLSKKVLSIASLPYRTAVAAGEGQLEEEVWRLEEEEGISSSSMTAPALRRTLKKS